MSIYLVYEDHYTGDRFDYTLRALCASIERAEQYVRDNPTREETVCYVGRTITTQVPVKYDVRKWEVLE